MRIIMRRRLKSQLDGILLRHNVSYTETRNQVFEVLKTRQPCTLRELQVHLEGKVSRRTVVSTVQLLESLGIIFRPEGKLIYVAHRQHGHELVCTVCGRRTPYRDERLERALERIAVTRDFIPAGHSVAMVGHCGKHVDRL